MLLVGYILFPITYALFSLFYALYGSILYVVGPFVLALYPAFGFGVMARKYLVNLMIFNAWGLLYSIFGALMAAINMNSVNAVLNSGNFVGAFNGVTGSLLLGLASILLSLCIALIPFLAKRIVEGDVGQTMISVISTIGDCGQKRWVAVQRRRRSWRWWWRGQWRRWWWWRGQQRWGRRWRRRSSVMKPESRTGGGDDNWKY